MKRAVVSDTAYVLAFFVLVISAGTVLLCMPFSWRGQSSLRLIDALFTATSAVCVTGLSTVNTADFSLAGQMVIMLLIQLGGLGIVSFTSLYLFMPGQRLPFRRLATIRSFSVEGVERDPRRIIRAILIFTFGIELIGALVLYPPLKAHGGFFSALFHSVSAFCNAGFSLYPDNLESFSANTAVLVPVMALITLGGLGFIVLEDIWQLAIGRKRKLSFHSRLVLWGSFILITGGAAMYFFLERSGAFGSMGTGIAALNAFFQSVTTRTAGFDAVPQADLGSSSKMLTMLLMFIGGSPGSIAGGIKVSTAFVVLVAMIRKSGSDGEINVFKRRLTRTTINTAIVYFIKALFLLLLAILLLSVAESAIPIDSIAFEAFSAFGTVGLSLGITGSLTVFGKLIIIATMYIGRVGLLAFLFFGGSGWRTRIARPEAEILIG
ncbi:MAG TPA: potassium transporter TrkG [Spirochaetales bacterium]|nr:potassium transporter TrkG [Spirochaetales bacterium]